VNHAAARNDGSDRHSETSDRHSALNVEKYFLLSLIRECRLPIAEFLTQIRGKRAVIHNRLVQLQVAAS
jgi:hypothetical protein